MGKLALPSAVMMLAGIGLLWFGLVGFDRKHGTFGERFATKAQAGGTPAIPR